MDTLISNAHRDLYYIKNNGLKLIELKYRAKVKDLGVKALSKEIFKIQRNFTLDDVYNYQKANFLKKGWLQLSYLFSGKGFLTEKKILALKPKFESVLKSINHLYYLKIVSEKGLGINEKDKEVLLDDYNYVQKIKLSVFRDH